jgi:hypothetical protein
MKKILTILLGFTLSLALNAQIKDWFNKISETETSMNYNGIPTMEGYVKGLIDAYGTDVYHDILNKIENGNIVEYSQYLRDLGGESIKEADYINHMMAGISCSKLYFVKNGKLYVITYDSKESPNYESLYLFRRDDDGWKPASNLIRKDVFRDTIYMKKFDSRTILWNRGNKNVNVEDLYYGSVNKISSGSMFITFGTQIWNPENRYFNYNSILVLVPHDKETYTATLFEPADMHGKKVNNTIYPILFGTRNIEYKEADDGFGLTIKYTDGTVDNPIHAGTVNFIINEEGHIRFGKNNSIGLIEIEAEK